MKILVVQQKKIGDVLVSTIICNNLRIAYPNAQIDFLAYESTIDVLKGNPNIDNVILFKDKHRKDKLELLKLGLSIRKSKYDLVIDAYSKLESWILVLLSGGKRKISYKKPGRTFIYTDNVPFAEFPETNKGLAIESRLSLLEPLHLNIKLDPVPKLYLSESEINDAKLLFKKHSVNTERKTILVSILGSEIEKTYPPKFMVQIIDYIAENFDVNILFNYFPSQLTEAQDIYSQCSEKAKKNIYFDLLGSDLRSFIGLMNECDLIIGNDGGAINMAKALDKPSFIIFAPILEKKLWATFEDGKKHVTVHINDYEPQLSKNMSRSQLKNANSELYQAFKPDFFLELIKDFIQLNLFEPKE
ncbi:glycosyltransferase family 9 protein [Flavobacterium sp. HJJ]|uniref:glycosyltransferase family 9 protein n=1 Tax=Flavobacterium sp. HJJ TaxID=2783792 RepID=UPI00188C7A1E|nr:glycosyltransferase family 9 protein [Flavobacterium sp. HJJ]MBF4472481.1 glycosyltransferase family 9 protein [Flavobacterium sp. HJJ]